MEKLINVQEIIEKPLMAIKEKYSYLDQVLDTEIISRGLIAPKYIESNSILFLGINPSFTKPYDIQNIDFYSNDNSIPYFKKFFEVVRDKEYNWTHLDLLFFRETNQKAVDLFLKENPIGVQFIWDQLMLSKQLLELSTPKIIIASNTKVRHLLGVEQNKERTKGVWMDYSSTFDSKIGTDRITSEGPLFNVPIFFTSMLSGQRALDNGSFKRLVWHIDFVLKNDKNRQQ
ncbi:MAG: hypothetical protein PHR83_01705 [Paludibacter sp.]|nr:hypothetical protein [Paludibacter sp.]